VDLESYKSFDGGVHKTIMALTSMTYIINLDDYDLHMEDEKIFNNFRNECQGFTLYI
jgi:hypothetical protein